MPWQYEITEKSETHKPACGKHAAVGDGPATFVNESGEMVGRCDQSITRELAEELLNTGIAYSSHRWSRPYPQRIFNVYRGVIYQAVETVQGRSYHGFPAREAPGRAPIFDNCTLEELAKMAHAKNELSLFKDWIETHFGRSIRQELHRVLRKMAPGWQPA